MRPLAPAAKPTPRQGRWFLLVGMLVALAIGVGGLRGFEPIARLDHLFLDAMTRATQTRTPARGTVVVDIDDVSLAAIGQWPWPRYRLAELVERIAAERPAAIALDILLPEADRASLADLKKTFKHDFGIDLAFSGVPEGLLDNDGYLGQQMARADVVGARYFYFDHATRETRPARPGVAFKGLVGQLALDHAPGVMDNVEALSSQTRTTGFVNMRVDSDNTLRRLPLLIEYNGVVHPSLALAATMRAAGVQVAEVVDGRDGASLLIGPHTVPVDKKGYALLRYEGPPSRYPSVPAVDVLAARNDPLDLRGRIVFIGSSAVGLNDSHLTATSRTFPGVGIHSVMSQNILDGRVLRAPEWGGHAALLLAVLLALGQCALFMTGRSLVVVGAAAMGAVIALGTLGYASFATAGWVLPIAAPILATALVLAMVFATRLLMQQRHAQRWRKQLENARQVTIESMAAVAETRDPETGAHIKRTQHYVRAIARQLRSAGHYAEILSDDYIHLLFLSAPLHDIGKVGVPDYILLKPGPLTAEEWVIMRKHAEFGRQIILSTSRHIEGDNFLGIASEIAATHHEKWDGTGYPTGLKGQAIPLSGRIMAVADIYDALISRRCYKVPFPHALAMEMMRDLRGTTFDTLVLDAFFAIEGKITRIAANFLDEETTSTQRAPTGGLPAAPVAVHEGVVP